jgi:hypothetical protein
LQLEGELLILAVKHRPVPEVPSSQEVQPLGQGWHFGPKKPDAQDSHEVPLKPVGQVHVPEAEQTPDPAQGGEHDVDCISTSERDPEEVDGNCPMSGTESQKMIRLFEFEVIASHTLEERDIEPADNGVDVFPIGVEGRAANDPLPV